MPTSNCNTPDGAGQCLTHDNDACHDRFSRSPPASAGGKVSQPEFHEKPFIGLASMMRMVSAGANLADLINIAAYNPNDANMLMGMSIIFQLTENRDMGLELQAKALKIRQLYHQPSASVQLGIRLLALMRPGDMMDNTPVDFLLEGSDTALDLLYVSPDLPFPESLPDHDVLIVALGQSDQNQPLLEKIGELIKSSPHPVLNMPDRISLLSRDSVSELLKLTPGVEIPITARIDREGLKQICRGEKSITTLLKDGGFPIIIRPLDSHAGKGLAKIDSPTGITDYLEARAENEFNIARFVDYRGPDGLYRKCRIVLIDGKPFACHLAISGNWMIHYKNAGMTESAAKRAEEANFMANFDRDFARRHKEAFRMIAERMRLDYLVIDCGETPEGKLLIFEADNLGFIHALDPVDIYPYKQPQMHKVFEAFCAMLKRAKDRGAKVNL